MLYSIPSVQMYDATAPACAFDFYARISVRKINPLWQKIDEV